MHWITDGERWPAWLVDYTAAGPRAMVRLGDRYPVVRAAKSDFRLESSPTPQKRIALSGRAAEIVTDRNRIDH